MVEIIRYMMRKGMTFKNFILWSISTVTSILLIVLLFYLVCLVREIVVNFDKVLLALGG